MKRHQRDAVIAVMLRGVVEAISRAYVGDASYDGEGISDLTYEEAINEAARLLARLPGEVWHLGLPDPGDLR